MKPIQCCCSRALASIASLALAATSSADLCGFSSCPVDLNGDAIVDGADLGSLLAAWGSCLACPQDFTGDGAVDGADLGLLLSGWGSCPVGATCPAAAQSCTTSSDKPGCGDAECCGSVCMLDAFCCLHAWDALCVAAGAAACAPADDCCKAHAAPGCGTSACAEVVCSISLACCTLAWDQVCADVAAKLCGPCDVAVPAITGVFPLATEVGSLLAIAIADFPDLAPAYSCFVVGPEGGTVGLRVIEATDSTITAQVGALPDGFEAGQVVVLLATSSEIVAPPLPENVELLAASATDTLVGKEVAAARFGGCLAVSPGDRSSSTSMLGAVNGGEVTFTVPQAILPFADGGIACGGYVPCTCQVTIKCQLLNSGNQQHGSGNDNEPACPCTDCCALACTTISFSANVYVPFVVDPLFGVAESIGQAIASITGPGAGGALDLQAPIVTMAPDGTSATVKLVSASGVLPNIPVFSIQAYNPFPSGH